MLRRLKSVTTAARIAARCKPSFCKMIELRPHHRPEQPHVDQKNCRPTEAVDNPEALRRAVLRGKGTAMLSEILAAADLRAKRLIELLPAFAAPERPQNLLYLRERQTSPKLRSSIEFIVERFGAEAASHNGD